MIEIKITVFNHIQLMGWVDCRALQLCFPWYCMPKWLPGKEPIDRYYNSSLISLVGNVRHQLPSAKLPKWAFQMIYIQGLRLDAVFVVDITGDTWGTPDVTYDETGLAENVHFVGSIAAVSETAWESVVERERESVREQGTEANANAFKISMPGCIHFILIHRKYFHASITTTGECSHPVAKRCHTLPNPGCLPSQCEGNIVKIS